MKNGLRRSLSLDDSTTDDIWQEFMVLLMNKPDTFSLADSERGKFRVYFFVLLRNFAISRLRTRHHFQSLDYVIDRTSENGIPSEILDIEWAATVWLVALTSMYDSCLKSSTFKFVVYLSLPSFSVNLGFGGGVALLSNRQGI